MTVRTGNEQLALRAGAAEHGAALRRSLPGTPMLVSFSPASLRVFPHSNGSTPAVPELATASAGGHS